MRPKRSSSRKPVLTPATPFTGKVSPYAVRTTLYRHEIKSGDSPSGLTPEGEKRAMTHFLHGKATGRRFRVTTSANPRAKTTGKLAAKTYRQLLGGEANVANRNAREGRVRVLQEMTMAKILPQEKMDKYVEIHGQLMRDHKLSSDEAEMRLRAEWMQGKYNNELGDAHQIADDIIYHTIGLGQEAAKRGAENISLANPNHSDFTELVVMRLTGRDIREFGPMIGFGEGLTVHFTKTGRAILEYRNQKFDVTKNLNLIMKSIRSGFK